MTHRVEQLYQSLCDIGLSNGTYFDPFEDVSKKKEN